MVSIVQYQADAPSIAWRDRLTISPWPTPELDEPPISCRATVRSGINKSIPRSNSIALVDDCAFLNALRVAQACIFAHAQAYERVLRSPGLLLLPGQEHEAVDDTRRVEATRRAVKGNARVKNGQKEDQWLEQTLSSSAWNPTLA